MKTSDILLNVAAEMIETDFKYPVSVSISRFCPDDRIYRKTIHYHNFSKTDSTATLRAFSTQSEIIIGLCLSAAIAEYEGD